MTIPMTICGVRPQPWDFLRWVWGFLFMVFPSCKWNGPYFSDGTVAIDDSRRPLPHCNFDGTWVPYPRRKLCDRSCVYIENISSLGWILWLYITGTNHRQPETCLAVRWSSANPHVQHIMTVQTTLTVAIWDNICVVSRPSFTSLQNSLKVSPIAQLCPLCEVPAIPRFLPFFLSFVLPWSAKFFFWEASTTNFHKHSQFEQKSCHSPEVNPLGHGLSAVLGVEAVRSSGQWDARHWTGEQ